MPNFNRAAALKGADGIREAADRKSGNGGDFKPFCPELQWRSAGEERYVLFLTPIDEALGFLTHEWVPVGTGTKANGETYKKYEWFFSRKDPAIGEDYDELQDRLDNDPRLKTFGVAVELEPVLEPGRGGRQKVVGFEVKTSTYNKKGEDDESIEVTQPIFGIVMQAAQNFWGALATFDEAQADITETPFQVVRRGSGTDTTYDFIHFMDVPVDLSNLIDYIDGVSYLTASDEFDGVLAEAASKDSERESALVLGEALLNTRLNELADKERYDSLVKPITHIEQRYPKKGKGKKGAPAAKTERPARPARTSRAKADAEAPAEAAEAAPAPEAAPAEAPKAKGDRFAALRARAEAK